MYHATAVREVNKGEAMSLADRFLAPLRNGKLPLEKRSSWIGCARPLRISTPSGHTTAICLKVGIVGEIYVKFNDFVNNRVAQWLMDQDIEVVVPDFLEFFLGWFVSVNEKVRANMDRRGLAWLLANVLDKYVHGIEKEVAGVMSDFKYYRPKHSIHDVAEKAREIVALTHQYGEGWLIAGEIGAFVEHGIQNVLCLQPFGCIANQVVARGVANRMKEKFDELNLIFLDLDAGISEVNFFNRMYFFINRARETVS